MGPTEDEELDEILRAFQVLKQGDGLTPAKMADALPVMSAMGETEPIRATQKLLDDLADLEGDDAVALRWALAAVSTAHGIRTLSARRSRSGVPVNTAKDRERRAVINLVSKWHAGQPDWARVVSVAVYDRLPIRASLRIGSFEALIAVAIDPNKQLPVVNVHTTGSQGHNDFLSVGARPEASLFAYGTRDQGWRLQILGPPLESDSVYVQREHDTPPRLVTVDATRPDGSSQEDRYSAEHVGPRTLIRIPIDLLDPPCVVAWYWAKSDGT